MTSKDWAKIALTFAVLWAALAASYWDLMQEIDSCVHPVSGEILIDYPEDTFRSHDGTCVHVDEFQEG